MEQPADPVIPITFMDGVLQRRTFAGLFVGIKAAAIRALWFPIEGDFKSRFEFWTLVDAAFLFLLFCLRVPMLPQRRGPWLWALFFLCVFNWICSAQQRSLLEIRDDVVDVLGFSRTLTLRTESFPEAMVIIKSSVEGESKDNVADIMFNSSLILGRHTVNILPQSTAKINPENKCFCLDLSSSKSSTLIPVLLNGTAPWTIEYVLSKFADGSSSHHNLTIPARTVVERPTGEHRQVQTAAIRVTEPGAYNIHRAIDAAGIDVRIYQQYAIVVKCPSAKFDDQENTYKPGVGAVPVRHVCVGDHTELPLAAEGFPPLTIYYERRINRDTKDLTVDSISPDDYDSKSVPLGLTNVAQWREINRDRESLNWSWGKERRVRVNLPTTFSTAGEIFYKIKRVTDACNNTYDYDVTSTTSRVTSIGTGDRRRFDVFNRPSARFKCDASKPIKIQTFPTNSKERHVESPMALIPLHLQGEAPWDIVYEVTPLANSREADFPHNVFGNHSIRIEKNEFAISIPHPAVVSLLSVKDANCQGSIVLPSSCSILQTLPPTLRLEPTPIREACVGEVGAEITLTLTGEAPWKVFYRQIRDDDRTSSPQIVDVDAPRRVLTLMPNVTGRYVYEFYQVTDLNYPKGVQVDKNVARYKQVVHPKPGGRWSQAHDTPIKACAGAEVPLEIELAGTGPWTLAWYWDNGNGVSQTMVDSELVARGHTVKVAVLSAGAYNVGLVNVTDANGCTQSLQSERAVQIDVKQNKPTVAFREPGPIKFAEGQRESLPLKLTGNPPWKLSWKKQEARDGIPILGVKDPNTAILVDQQGIYELLSVSDAYCSGTVVEEARLCEALWIPKPSLSVKPELPPVCEDEDYHFEVSLTGQAPWTVVYDREYTRPVNVPIGKNAPPAREELKVQTGHPIARVHSYTAVAGDYRYRFKSISDDIYSKPIALPRSDDAHVVHQHVYPRPQAKFANPSKQNVLCVGDDLSESGGFTIDLIGSAPFEVTFEIRQEGSTRPHTITVPDIRPHGHQYAFRPPKNTFVEVGKYTVSIVGVTDAMKCGGKSKGNNGLEDGTKVTVEVSDVAGIAPLTAQSDGKCVGDILSYALQGVPPWHVEYEFNGHRTSVYDIMSPKFTQLANNVGNITITKVCHQQPDHCCTRPEGLTNIIHQLPGVVLSGGRDIIEDIREGDKTEILVDFSGDPPFSFTYTRSEPSKYTSHEHPAHPAVIPKQGVQNVLETHTVSGIQTRQHSIVTSQEGTFEITSVVDKWCEFPRVAKGVGGATVLPGEKKVR